MISENVIMAALGGLVYNIVPLLELWKMPVESRPDFRNLLYWIPYLIWPLLAGFLYYLYESPEFVTSKLIAFHIGVTAPLAFRKMIEVLPVIPAKIKLRDGNQ
jgi:hypothetical protein